LLSLLREARSVRGLKGMLSRVGRWKYHKRSGYLSCFLEGGSVVND